MDAILPRLPAEARRTVSEACFDRSQDPSDPVEPPGPRDTTDDFFCLRFQVHYPSLDCAIRTKHRTCPACFDCDQGRFNLKRHERSPAVLRFRLPSSA